MGLVGGAVSTTMTQEDVSVAFTRVPLPSFASECDIQVGDPPYRVLMGYNRHAGPITVGTTAVQFLDGRIDDGEDGDEPKVWIWDTGVSTDHARQLAAALIAAADELDGLVQR